MNGIRVRDEDIHNRPNGNMAPSPSSVKLQSGSWGKFFI